MILRSNKYTRLTSNIIYVRMDLYASILYASKHSRKKFSHIFGNHLWKISYFLKTVFTGNFNPTLGRSLEYQRHPLTTQSMVPSRFINNIEMLCGTWLTTYVCYYFLMATAYQSLGFPSFLSQTSRSPITGVQFSWYTW